MNGRLYDPMLRRFLAPDNYIQDPYNTQNFNRYGYVYNNPLMYNDPSGEFWHIVIGAAIGGVINVVSNWDNIDNFGEGLAAFGAGAAHGGLTAAFGPAGAIIGGAITGATNSIISQTGNGVGLGDVNWGNVGLGAFVGAASGAAGYGAGQLASKYIGGIALNGLNVSANSAIGGTISGAIGGAAGGYAGGFAGGYIMTGDISKAHEFGTKGAIMGGPIGGVSGGIGGYISAKNAGLNPLTGKPRNSIGIGEGQSRVDLMSRNTDSETIAKDWMKSSEAFGKGDNFGGDRLQGKLFNRDWMVDKIQKGYKIYDFGHDGRTIPSQNYNLELRIIKGFEFNTYKVFPLYKNLYYYK